MSAHPLFSLKVRSTNPDAGLLVLLHGVGSNEQDLFALGSLCKPWFHVVSLRAPIALAQGYAWFEVAFTPDGPKINAAAEVSSRKILAEQLTALQQELNVAPQHTWLFGFSQGAIMSYNILLTHPALIAGAVAMNGRLLPEVWPERRADADLKGKKLFIGHTRQDQVIAIEQARSAKAHFDTLPLTLAYHEFDGPHTITEDALKASLLWLQEHEALV